jgi:hypothetical protein
MERAYVRRQEGDISRRWVPIGWYCHFCGELVESAAPRQRVAQLAQAVDE